MRNKKQTEKKYGANKQDSKQKPLSNHVKHVEHLSTVWEQSGALSAHRSAPEGTRTHTHIYMHKAPTAPHLSENACIDLAHFCRVNSLIKPDHRASMGPRAFGMLLKKTTGEKKRWNTKQVEKKIAACTSPQSGETKLFDSFVFLAGIIYIFLQHCVLTMLSTLPRGLTSVQRCCAYCHLLECTHWNFS